MIRRAFTFAALSMFAGTSAMAQIPGGGGGGGHGRSGKGGQSKPPAAASKSDLTAPAETPVSEVDVFGVIESVDPKTQRITIAYEANDSLNLPAGTMPFEVAKTELLKDATAGERIRFRLDSHQVSFLTPIAPPPSQP